MNDLHLHCLFDTQCMQVISVDLPNTIQLEVTETAPGVKGNTVSGGTKAATLETGAVIQVCCCWCGLFPRLSDPVISIALQHVAPYADFQSESPHALMSSGRTLVCHMSYIMSINTDIVVVVCVLSAQECCYHKMVWPAQVPLFIAQGQKILVDPKSNSYMSKVK